MKKSLSTPVTNLDHYKFKLTTIPFILFGEVEAIIAIMHERYHPDDLCNGMDYTFVFGRYSSSKTNPYWGVHEFEIHLPEGILCPKTSNRSLGSYWDSIVLRGHQFP
jgi:hypothetical protein